MERVEELREGMTAITLRLSIKNTSSTAEDEYHKVKVGIKVREKAIEENLCERSHMARLMSEHEAEYEAQQLDALCQQWYEWIRASKRNNMEKESKRFVGQTKQKGMICSGILVYHAGSSMRK